MAGRLPTFLIIGVPKAGTTSLASYLGAHPEVFMSHEKELHFFDRHYDEGLEWYREHFAGAGDAKAVGEATPTYVYNEHAVPRIAETLPDAKLILLLRNPIDRAYSNYWYQRSLGFESRSFIEAVRAEMRDPAAKPFRHLGRGRYLPYVERVCEHMPRAHLCVLLFEDLRDQASEVFARACRFVGVDPRSVPAAVGSAENRTTMLRSDRLRRSMLRNRAWKRLPQRFVYAIDRMNRVERRYPPMDPALRAELVAWFADDNAALGRWLGADLGVWAR